MKSPLTPPLSPAGRGSARCLRRNGAIIVALTLAFVVPAYAQLTNPSAKTRGERKVFSDAEIVDGFLKVAFGAEYHSAGHVDRIRKYEAPVRIAIDGAAQPARRAQIVGVVRDIAAHVEHLNIAMADDGDEANVVVRLVRDRDLLRTMTTFYGSERAHEIRKNLDPQCLSGFRKNERFEIERSDVILTIDNGDFVFLDCAYEELLQSLGPINDTDSVPWTMFNDEVQKGYFDVYDQYLLNILYHPRIKAGMSVADVTELLPGVLADVRAYVGRVNGLAPSDGK